MADRWLTFDCYGTVADWNSGMGGALAGLAGVSGADAGRLLTAYHQAELEIEADPQWRPYRGVLTAGLARAAERERVRLPRGGEEAFVRAWANIPVFDDAGPALASHLIGIARSRLIRHRGRSLRHILREIGVENLSGEFGNGERSLDDLIRIEREEWALGQSTVANNNTNGVTPWLRRVEIKHA
jgi:hypothetical protein